MKQITHYRGGLAALLAIAGAAAISACSDMSGSGTHQVSLSFTTGSTSAASRASLGLSNDIMLGSANELVITKIQLMLDKIEISKSDQTACTEDGEDSGDDLMASDRGSGSKSDSNDDCEDVAADPMLVNVPVTDAVSTIVSVPLTAGTYKKLEAKLGPADASQLTALGVPSDMAGKSIRVEGTYKGAPFVFTSPVRTKLEMEFNPPLVVDATTKNATVKIDVTKWFTTSGGAVIDPTSANVGGANAQLVASNIRGSFRAFEDDDRRGDDDSLKDGGSGQGGRDH